MSEVNQDEAVFIREGDLIVPTALARGPWRTDAQHGGAPAALLAGLAETAVEGPGWLLARLTLELMRPVPVAPLTVEISSGKGRTVRRVALTLKHDEVPVARANALLLRSESLDLPPPSAALTLPKPEACPAGFHILGMPHGISFSQTAVEARVARGSIMEPGPAAAWFRLAVPLLKDTPTSAAMRAVAAADFGNGISWTLPFDSFLFANTDLTVYLHRPPGGDWVAVDSATTIAPSGVGLVHSTLYDETGPIGVAQQNLLVRAR